MNNMQRAFKKKATRGLADGGRPSPNMLGTGTAAAAGIALARRPQQIEAAIEAATGTSAATAPSAPAGYGGLSARRDNAMPPAHMLLAQRRGLADGGGLRRKPHGGEVEGPGGPTDDEAGVYALSDEEYVLPGDTVEAMGGPEVLDEIRNATHEFVDEKNRPGLANGGQPRVRPGAYTVTELPYERAPVAEHVSVQAPQHTARAVEFRAPQRASGAPISNRAGPGRPSAEVLRAAPAPTAPSVTGARPRAPYASGDILRPTKQAGRGVRIAKGAFKSIGAPLAVASAIGDSAAENSTARYAKRFGVSEPTGDGSASDMLKFAGLRAGGFASDLGNTLTLGAAGNLYRDKPGGLLQFNSEATPAPPAPAAAPPAPAATTASTTPATPAQLEDQRVSQALLKEGVSLPDQGDARMSYSDAQASSMRHDAGLGAGKNYKLGGGGDRTTVPGALDGSVYDNGNADIYATSTRADGKLNSFTGVGNGNRPNWEQRNPADFQAAAERAAADKAKLVGLAAGNIDGTADGLDRAWRLAAGDPEATAAVQRAIDQRGLRQAALNGNSSAASILSQQGKDATDVQVANITTDGAARVASAKARADMAKAAQDQKNSDREFGLRRNADTRAGGELLRKRQDRALEDSLGPRIDPETKQPNARYAEFAREVQQTLINLGAPADQVDASLDNISEGDLQRLLRASNDKKALEPGFLEQLKMKYIDNRPYVASDDLNVMAPDPSTYEDGFFGGSVQNGLRARMYVPGDMTYDQQKRMGAIK